MPDPSITPAITVRDAKVMTFLYAAAIYAKEDVSKEEISRMNEAAAFAMDLTAEELQESMAKLHELQLIKPR